MSSLVNATKCVQQISRASTKDGGYLSLRIKGTVSRDLEIF
jgi:hypothetical protein